MWKQWFGRLTLPKEGFWSLSPTCFRVINIACPLRSDMEKRFSHWPQDDVMIMCYSAGHWIRDVSLDIKLKKGCWGWLRSEQVMWCTWQIYSDNIGVILRDWKIALPSHPSSIAFTFLCCASFWIHSVLFCLLTANCNFLPPYKYWYRQNNVSWQYVMRQTLQWKLIVSTRTQGLWVSCVQIDGNGWVSVSFHDRFCVEWR